MQIPNVCLGSYLGFKRATIKNPGKVNKLSKDIPDQPIYLRTKFLIPTAGVIPFA
jgi:transmembrane 9 superfamily protein 2/4